MRSLIISVLLVATLAASCEARSLGVAKDLLKLLEARGDGGQGGQGGQDGGDREEGHEHDLKELIHKLKDVCAPPRDQGGSSKRDGGDDDDDDRPEFDPRIAAFISELGKDDALKAIFCDFLKNNEVGEKIQEELELMAKAILEIAITLVQAWYDDGNLDGDEEALAVLSYFGQLRTALIEFMETKFGITVPPPPPTTAEPVDDEKREEAKIALARLVLDLKKK